MSLDQSTSRKIYRDIRANNLTLNSGIVEGDKSPNNPTNNFSATTDPTVTDDSDAGYLVGSRWVNTVSGDIYTCVDSTVGAAVWSLGGGGSETFTTINTVNGSNPQNNISAPGNYKIVIGNSSVTGTITFVPVEADILKLCNTGSATYVLDLQGSSKGGVYSPSNGLPNRAALLSIRPGDCATIRYFTNGWNAENTLYSVSGTYIP